MPGDLPSNKKVCNVFAFGCAEKGTLAGASER